MIYELYYQYVSMYTCTCTCTLYYFRACGEVLLYGLTTVSTNASTTKHCIVKSK